MLGISIPLVLVASLLVATVDVALRLSGLAGLAGSRGDGSLDYARGPAGAYFPLTDAFVADALGPAFASGSGAGPQDIPGVAPTETAPAGEANGGGNGGEEAAPPDDIRADLGNDNFANAYAIRRLPFSARSTAPSTREPGEPVPCGPPGVSRWFRYTPRTNVGLVATTRGTELGASIAVYTGDAMDGLTPVGCGGGPSGGGHVAFAAEAGTTYWFQASKTIGAGVLVFSLHVRGVTSMASVGEDGRPGSGQARWAHVSGNGRYVVFSSEADLTGHGTVCYSDHHPSAKPKLIVVPTPGPCFNVYVRDLVTKTTVLASPSTRGGGGNQDTFPPAISYDGRYVAFYSYASDLVPGDTNGTVDVFRRDLVAGTTERVSLTSEGRQTHDPDYVGPVVISGDGRYVGFGSGAPQLGAPVRDERCAETTCYTTFVRDMVTGTTTLVSRDEDGELMPGDSLPVGISADGSRILLNVDISVFPRVVAVDWRDGKVHDVSVSTAGDPAAAPAYNVPNGGGMSADGRYVTFVSAAANLSEERDTNNDTDVFVRDLLLGRTRRISVSSSGAQSTPPPDNAPGSGVVSYSAGTGYIGSVISANGRFVVFTSNAADLVPGDNNGVYDVFVRDLLRGTTERVSLRNDGTETTKPAIDASISGDGNTISFLSQGFHTEDDQAFTAVYAQVRPRI
ncbi:MAG TPA: hypothetical protein VNA12_02035 [Mycobacteriales bacterium]|nr:hypothetical protein [Mycobacteriales bacterium]